MFICKFQVNIINWKSSKQFGMCNLMQMGALTYEAPSMISNVYAVHFRCPCWDPKFSRFKTKCSCSVSSNLQQIMHMHLTELITGKNPSVGQMIHLGDAQE